MNSLPSSSSTTLLAPPPDLHFLPALLAADLPFDLELSSLDVEALMPLAFFSATQATNKQYDEQNKKTSFSTIRLYLN